MTQWGRDRIEPLEQPPAPPAAWLEPCHDPQTLPEGRPLAPEEAWGAVFGDRGLVAAWRCERVKRTCVRRWYAERLWEQPAAIVATCELEPPAAAPIA